jgi:SpoVK/Ycf46/Vps4 family AAA+-type ATPase
VTNLLGSLPSGRWVFPRRLQLKDYNDEHLRLILLQLIRHNLFAVEGGDDGPYPRIVAKRVGRGRKSSGFANVYDLVLAFGKIVDRQALRLKKGLADGPKSRAQTANKTDDNQIANSACSLLTRQDLIGPEPKDVRHYSTAWKEFEQMVGLDSVKGAIGELLTRAKVNYRREIVDKEPLQTSLNRVFIGPPGTGKTTVAKLYGQILADIGLLSTKEVVYKTPDDFLGQYMGESEAKTSQILDSTVGKVLIVDDAHMIYQGGKGNCASETDNYRLGCIDTIVTKIHNRPGEDRCVILLGYPDLMEEMFRNVNPGLRRRFPLEEAFRFQNYDDEHLNQILRLKMAKEEISATEHAMDVAAEVLRRSRDRPNFGNGGDVDNLLNQAKTRFRGRQETDKTIQTEKPKATQPDIYNGDISDSDSEENNTIVLEPQDFDPEWDRGVHATKKCQALFDGLIGFEPIINTFQGYHRMAANLRRRGRDPRDIVPFTFLFKGPPGTGKTHTARIVGQIFYDMGFLSTAEVIECSASHLIGQYMGQTAPKVIDMFERALGKVLFIDEAYRLAGGAGSLGGTQTYESEAVGELVDCMTKKRYLKKMVIVLAGYDKDMDSLIQVNAGLRGRFATEIVFPPMDATRMREYLYKLLNKEDIEVWDEAKPELGGEEAMLKLLGDLSRTPGWSNGRDIKTLAGVITGEVYKTAALEDLEDGDENVFRISTAQLNGFLEDMLRQRTQVGEAGRETDKIGSYE